MKGRRSRLNAKRSYGSKEVSGGAGLYVYTFPSQRGKKLKIGFSGKDVERRIRQQISHTSIPEIAEIELIVFIRDAEALEKDLHRVLRSRRVVDTFGSKEWFSISSVGELLKIAPALRLACDAAERGKMSYLAAQEEAARQEQLQKKKCEELEARAQRIATLKSNLSELRNLFTKKKDGGIGINHRKIFIRNVLEIYAIIFLMTFVIGIPFIVLCLIEYWIFGTPYIALIATSIVIFGPILFSAFDTLSTSTSSLRRKEKLILDKISEAESSSLEDGETYVSSEKCLDPNGNNTLDSIYDVSRIGSHNLIELPLRNPQAV